MRSLKVALLMCLFSTPVLAIECPKDVSPCKVIFVTPQEYQWLAGTPTTSAGSVIDMAIKNGGADISVPISMLLGRLRAAEDGTPSKDQAKDMPLPPAKPSVK